MFRFLSILKNVARIDDWWFSKIAPLLAVAFFLLLSTNSPLREGTIALCCVVFSILCVAIYGHVVNDVSDVEADALAGRQNAMSGRGPGERFLFSILPLVCGILPGFIIGYPAIGWGLLLTNFLWPTLYSLFPFRIKERGVWGVLLDAAGSHVTPALFLLVVLSRVSPSPEVPGLLRCVAITLWSVVSGLKGILYHQLSHLERDGDSDTKTWGRTIGRDRLARYLPCYNLAIELPANIALALAFLPWSPLTGIFLVIYLVVEIIKKRLGFEFALDENPENRRPVIPFSNDLFYDCWLPLSVAIHLALTSPGWFWAPLLVLLLFARNYFVLIRDLRAVGKQLFQRLRAK